MRLAAYLAALIGLLAGGCFMGASNRSQQQLAQDTSQDRSNCQLGSVDACAAYIGDTYIASHCTMGEQNPGVPIVALTGAANYVEPECAARVREVITMLTSCNNGDQASCADIDARLAAAQKQKESADQTLAQSAVNAQWAQARAQAATARQIQMQNRLAALQILMADQRSSTLAVSPSVSRQEYCGGLAEQGLGQSYYANKYCR